MKLVIGVSDPLPLRNFPPGKIKLRLRNEGFAMAFVRDENGIRQFAIAEIDGHWEPGPELEQGRNVRTFVRSEKSANPPPPDAKIHAFLESAPPWFRHQYRNDETTYSTVHQLALSDEPLDITSWTQSILKAKSEEVARLRSLVFNQSMTNPVFINPQRDDK